MRRWSLSERRSLGIASQRNSLAFFSCAIDGSFWWRRLLLRPARLALLARLALQRVAGLALHRHACVLLGAECAGARILLFGEGAFCAKKDAGMTVQSK